MNKPTVISVTGASASGKSLFTQTVFNEISAELGDSSISIIKEDSYYRSQDNKSMKEREQTNYDHPEALDHDLLCKQLLELIDGKTINTPVYCYKKHTRTAETNELRPTKVILVEGILLLSNKSLRENFDIKLYMDTPIDVCLARRIQRDINERGRSVNSTIQQYFSSIRPMYYQYIEPSKALADIAVTGGGENRMAIELIKAKIRQLTKQN